MSSVYRRALGGGVRCSEFRYEDHLRRLSGEPGQGAIPCRLISNINRLTEILQCNILMLPMRHVHGSRVRMYISNVALSIG